jgi:hypothetical protein
MLAPVAGVVGDSVTGPNVAVVQGDVQLSVHVPTYAASSGNAVPFAAIVTCWLLANVPDGSPVIVAIVGEPAARVIAPAASDALDALDNATVIDEAALAALADTVGVVLIVYVGITPSSWCVELL